MTRTIPLALLLTACASGGGEPELTKDPAHIGAPDAGTGDDTQNGTRIEMRHWVGDDGSRIPAGQHGYDAELSALCEPMRIGTEQASRCVPLFEAAPCLFTDHLCSVPALRIQNGTPLPSHVRQRACHDGGSYAVRAVETVSPVLYQEYGPGDCQQVNDQSGLAQFYGLGEDVGDTLERMVLE